MHLFLVGVVALLVLAAAVATYAAATGPDTSASYQSVTSAAAPAPSAAVAALTTTGSSEAALLAPALDAPGVAAAVIPSVVYVEVSDTNRRGEAGVVASGSGVVLDGDGHVVTNGHVVTAGRTYRVVLPDGRTYDATLDGLDQTTDLAVLDIDAAELTPIAFGSSDDLRVGDAVVAVGKAPILGRSAAPA